MKSILFIFILVFIFALPAVAQTENKITESYDKFKDLTNLSVRIGIFNPNGGFSSWIVQAEFTGEKAVNPKIYLMLLSVSDDWKFLDRELTLFGIINNERYSIGKLTRAKAQVSEGGVSEILSMIISFKSLETLGNASTLEMKVGSDEFNFTNEQISIFKNFANKLKSIMTIPIKQNVKQKAIKRKI